MHSAPFRSVWCSAVGSIHRVQASLTRGSSAQPTTTVPQRLLSPSSELISNFNALHPAQIDDAVIADLQNLLREAQQRIARI
jgi:hypothetical protein